MILAVLDVNVLVSAAFSREGAPGKLLEEPTKVLVRPRIRKRMKEIEADQLIESLLRDAPVVNDPDDYLIWRGTRGPPW